MIGDHIYVDTQGQSHFCAHCGTAEPIKAPAPIQEMIDAMEAFGRAHRACPTPPALHSPPPPDRPLPLPETVFSPWPGLANWLRHGEIGQSSLTMAAAATGLPLADYPSLPADASDFRRCVGLLDAVPALRSPLLTAGTPLGPHWGALIRSWPELEALACRGPDSGSWRTLTERIQSLVHE